MSDTENRAYGKAKNRSKRAISAVFTSYLNAPLRMIIGFVMTPLILGFIGSEKYGLWVIIGSLLGYMGRLDLGITGSVSTFIARKQHEESGHSINVIISNSIFLQIIIGGAALILGYCLSFFITDFFGIGEELKGEARTVFMLAVLGLSISFPLRSLKAILRGTQNITTLIWVESFNYILRSALIIAFLFTGLDLLALPTGTIIVTIFAIGIVYYFALQTNPKLKLSAKLIKKVEIKKIFSVSIWWFLGGIGALFIYSTDNILIGHYLGATTVTAYALTYRVAEMSRNLIFQINSSLMPGVGDLVGRKEYDKLKSVYLFSLKTVINMSLIFSAFLIIYNRHVVKFWVGEENFGGQTLTIIFAVTLIQFTVFHSAAVILSNFLKVKGIAVLRWTEGSLNLLLSIILVRYYGVLGIAFATLAAGFLTSFWYVPYKANQILGIGLQELKSFIIYPAVKSLIIISALSLIFNQFSIDSLLFLILNILSFFAASSLCLAFTSYNNIERNRILKVFKFA